MLQISAVLGNPGCGDVFVLSFSQIQLKLISKCRQWTLCRVKDQTLQYLPTDLLWLKKKKKRKVCNQTKQVWKIIHTSPLPSQPALSTSGFHIACFKKKKEKIIHSKETHRTIFHLCFPVLFNKELIFPITPITDRDLLKHIQACEYNQK